MAAPPWPPCPPAAPPVRDDFDAGGLAPAWMSLRSRPDGCASTADRPGWLTLRARVVPHVSRWTLIGQITCGRLVGPPVPARPG